MCICIAESLFSSPKIITTLLVSYTPIQNRKFFFFFLMKKEVWLDYLVGSMWCMRGSSPMWTVIGNISGTIVVAFTSTI